VTAASAVMRGVTRHRLLSIALAASLALNLFFVAGAVWIRLHGPLGPVPISERAQHIAEELNLDPTHRAALLHYFQDLRAHLRQMHREVGPLVRAAWAELAKPNADETVVMRLFDEAAQKRRGFQREVTASTLSFLATLTPDQRKKFVELARQRPPRWARPVKRGVTP
jgi:uncharacterized membrane protein